MFIRVSKKWGKASHMRGASFRRFQYAPDPDGGGGKGEEGDDGDGDGDDERSKLLKSIETRTAKAIEDAGKKLEKGQAEAIRTIVNEFFGDLRVEELRTLVQAKDDDKKIMKRMAAQLDAIERRGGAKAEKEGLKAILETRMKDIEKAFKGGAPVTLNVRAAAIMTTDNVIEYPDPLPADIIESFSFAQYVPNRYGADWIWNLVDREVVQEITEHKTWLEEGDFEGAFAVIGEGVLKPLVSANLVRNFATYSKAAGKYVVTEEVTKFRKTAYSIIQRIIRDQLARDYVDILTTAILAASAGYVGTAMDGTVAMPNNYDAIAAVAAQIESQNFNPNMLGLNPVDKWIMRVLKTSEGAYLFPAVTEDGIARVFEFRVTTSSKIAAGNFVLGESGLYKVEEEPVTVRIGHGLTMNGATAESDFDHNRFRVIVEVFFNHWLATNHIGSFVYASFATVKAAIAAA